MLLLTLTFTAGCVNKNPPPIPATEQLQQYQCKCQFESIKEPIFIGKSIFNDILSSLRWCLEEKILTDIPNISSGIESNLSSCTCNEITKEDLTYFIVIEKELLRQLSESLLECKNKLSIETPKEKAIRHCYKDPFYRECIIYRISDIFC